MVPSTRATVLVGRMATAAASATPATKGGQADVARSACASVILGKRRSRASRARARKRMEGPCCQSALDALDQALVANANARPQTMAQRRRVLAEPCKRRYARRARTAQADPVTTEALQSWT